MTETDIDRFADAVIARMRQDRDERPLLTPKQVGERLGISERTARDLIQTGGIPSVKIGGNRRVEAAEVDRFIAARRGGQ